MRKSVKLFIASLALFIADQIWNWGITGIIYVSLVIGIGVIAMIATAVGIFFMWKDGEKIAATVFALLSSAVIAMYLYFIT